MRPRPYEVDMKQSMSHSGVMGWGPLLVAIVAAPLTMSSQSNAESNVLAVADFGDGVTAEPDGFDDLLIRDVDTGMVAILFLDEHGLDMINHAGPVSGIDIIDGGRGYVPTFETDDLGLSSQIVSPPEFCRIVDTATDGVSGQWAGFVVDGEEGTLLIESLGAENRMPIDHAVGARTRIIIAHDAGGVGYSGVPGRADELRCVGSNRIDPLSAPVTVWSLAEAAPGETIAVAAPGRTIGVQSFFAWVPIPGGPIGSGYAANVRPPGLEMKLIGDFTPIDPPEAEPLEDETVESGEVDAEIEAEAEIEEAVTSEMIAARVLAQVFADRSDEQRLPAARVLTDREGRLTHVAFDPGTVMLDSSSVFIAPSTGRSDGLGVLELKRQGQINYVDIPGETAGSNYLQAAEPRLEFTASGGTGPSRHGFEAVAPEAEVARGTIVDMQITAEAGIFNRPPAVDLTGSGGLGADIRIRLGHEGTGQLRFNGQDVEMGSNWKAYPMDFDDDGDRDLLWHDAQTGRSAVWRLGDDSTIQQSTFGWLPSVDSNWRVGAVGDFDHGTPGANIFWRNIRTGANAIWGVDASGVWTGSTSWLHKASGMVDSVADTDWQVIGGNDGGNRLLWWNRNTGTCAIWKLDVDMTGGTDSSQWLEHARWLTSPLGEIMSTDTGWKPLGMLNLAGRSPSTLNTRDVLWMETSSGKLAGWLMASNFSQVDGSSPNGGANYIGTRVPEGMTAEAATVVAGHYVHTPVISRKAGGDGSPAPRASTTLFWLQKGFDGAHAWKLDRSMDAESGLLEKPWDMQDFSEVR